MLLKSEDLRRGETDEIREKLVSMDVTPTNFSELEAFWKLLDDYVMHGWGATGKVPIPRLRRRLEYNLPTQEGRPCTAVLRFTGPPPDESGRRRRA